MTPVDMHGPDLEVDLLNSFIPISLQDLLDTVSPMGTSLSPLDSLSTKLLKAIMDVVALYLLSIINNSLSPGRLPDLFKMACVQPLLKGPTLVTADIQNFRPISKLSFISKIIERVVLTRLLEGSTKGQ